MTFEESGLPELWEIEPYQDWAHCVCYRFKVTLPDGRVVAEDRFETRTDAFTGALLVLVANLYEARYGKPPK